LHHTPRMILVRSFQDILNSTNLQKQIYTVSEKNFITNTFNLNLNFARMQDEPKAKHQLLFQL